MPHQHTKIFMSTGGDARSSQEEELVDRGRPSTPYHILEILLQNSGSSSRTILPGINLRRVEMFRRRSTTSSLGGTEQTISLELPREPPRRSNDEGLRSRHRPQRPLTRQTTLALLTVGEDQLRIRSRYKRKSSDDPEILEAPPPYSAAVQQEQEAADDHDHDEVEDLVLPPTPTIKISPQEMDDQLSPATNGDFSSTNRSSHSNRQQQQQQNPESESTSLNHSSMSQSSTSINIGGAADHHHHQRDVEETAQQPANAGGHDGKTGFHEQETCCTSWTPWFLRERPVLKLFLVMFINGLISLLVAYIFTQLEGPAQEAKMEDRTRLFDRMMDSWGKLNQSIQGKDINETLFEEFVNVTKEYFSTPPAAKWDMLNASAFVTSVSSTTGYGDIVPITTGGRIFTLVYALYGIPVFIWYIVKLGALFRVLVMRALRWIWKELRHSFYTRERIRQQLRDVFVTVAQPVQVQPDFSTEFQDGKRFHPIIIGVILLIYLISVSGFISYMENISYFNALYACFITYSTIGFGDFDIYKTSYRANWLTLIVYGNLIHIIGYVIVSAWISSILDKCGIRKY